MFVDWCNQENIINNWLIRYPDILFLVERVFDTDHIIRSKPN